ncbi:hypothetical protein MWU49_13435 [Alcanivorax sp. S6407]|uniref:hypothetical protein n=1 Tax=Alcanivorax sp. S6407 TaxID=2926424 RepID=UPI001FF22687|nr:hypothetical protein [Alcanivorax sp. S6407]MCK0154716.1 hypothetical protein [Alcanivorax sp. S6407]
MNVEEELSQWLDINIPLRRVNKSRDAQAVLLHYGFGDIAWPTLEQIGEQLSIGTRERVRQVLNSTFKTKASIEHFPVLRVALEEISKVDFESIPEVRKRLISLGVISPSTRIRGLLNLGSDLRAIGNYELVDHDLTKLSRSEAEFDEKTFLGTKSAIGDLKKTFKKAKTLPGLLGLAAKAYLEDEIGPEAADRIWRFMELGAEAEVIKDGDQQWYIFENRDNTLINSCEKVASISSSNNVQVLAETLRNSLRRRTKKYEYPSSEVIRKWIYQSKWFEITNGVAVFLVSPQPLTEIEQAVVQHLAGKGPSMYPPLKDHLLGLGFSKPNIDKAVTTSPLVFVDKTDIRKKYTYTLISEVEYADKSSADFDERYRVFSNRLKRLLTTGGPEVSREVRVRREQSILREWLFNGKLSENCAICGKEYSVAALVTAHKKKRADCTDSEKTDPRIVFPLCLFGCDFLYEAGMVRIFNGKVVSSRKDTEQTTDILVANAVDGNAVDERWLKGKASYFGQT